MAGHIVNIGLRSGIVVAGVLACVFSTAVAFAQAQPAAVGSSRATGLFGGAGVDANAHQSLNLSMSLIEAYDGNRLADVGSVTPTVFQTGGFYTGFVPGVDFASHTQRVHVAVTAGSNLRYYGDVHQVIATSHAVGAGLTAQVTRTTVLFVNQGVSYAPAYLYGLFAKTGGPAAGDVIAPAADYAMNTERSYAYVTNASVTQSLTPRTTLFLGADARYTTFVGHAPGFSDLHAYDAGGRITYAVNRDVKLRIGYTFRDTQYSAIHTFSEHDLDVGIDLSRPLSRTRRTTVGFSVGPTSANVPVPELAGVTSPAPESRSRQYWVGADAFLNHQMGRSWNARGTLHRGVVYVEGLPNPVFTNALAVVTDGFLNRRTDLVASAAYTEGVSAWTGTPGTFATYTGDVRMRFAMSKLLATYVEYVYYFYNFDRNLPLPPDIPPRFSRNGVRIGLTLWVPVRRK
jgi:hypothetical protein